MHHTSQGPCCPQQTSPLSVARKLHKIIIDIDINMNIIIIIINIIN